MTNPTTTASPDDEDPRSEIERRRKPFVPSPDRIVPVDPALSARYARDKFKAQVSILARIQALKAAVQADFTGRHAEGEAEVAAQRKRLTRLEHERAKAKAAYYDDALTLDDFKLEQARIGREVKAANEAISHWTIEVDAMTRALDEVLSLLSDPYRLYAEAPDGINLMLVQALCEKVWILDTGVVGVDLTPPVAELLTVEARVAWDEADQTDDAGPEGVTYYRRARPLIGLLADLEQSWPRLHVERPYGPLPLERQNPDPQVRQGSDVLLLVRVQGL